MLETKIEWATHTFNPWWGCIRVSPACDHCYAEGISKRFGHKVWGKNAPRRIMSEEYWRQPLAWNKKAGKAGQRHQVFCGSMCDVMEDNPAIAAEREKLFDLIEKTPKLDWLLLTKRPQNFKKFLPKTWQQEPRPNVWLMTTVEEAKYLHRIDSLFEVPAVVYGISCEPLFGPITLPKRFLDLGKRAWVIAGGESGPSARKSNPDWFRGLRDQCVGAGVPFFFKQWGAWSDGLIRIGKTKAGRVLDGRTWDEYPGPVVRAPRVRVVAKPKPVEIPLTLSVDDLKYLGGSIYSWQEQTVFSVPLEEYGAKRVMIRSIIEHLGYEIYREVDSTDDGCMDIHTTMPYAKFNELLGRRRAA